jgi:hypothetical protein
VIVRTYGFPGCLTRPTGDLDSQLFPRDVHVEACQIALSAARFHGSGLELKHDKAGVSVSAHQVPEHPDHSLPATLRMTGLSERNSDPLPRVFKVQRGRPGRPGSRDALPGAQPYLRANRFQGHARPSRRRENPPQDPRWRPRVRSRCRQPPAARFGDLDPIPFRGRRGLGA